MGVPDVHEPDIPSGYGKREHVTQTRGVDEELAGDCVERFVGHGIG